MPRPSLVFPLVLTLVLFGTTRARAQTPAPLRAASAVRAPVPTQLRPVVAGYPVRIARALSLDPPPGRRPSLRLSFRQSDWLTGDAGVTWGPHGLLGRLEFRFPVF